MIKVLIVDDSAIVRSVLTREITAASDMEVVGTAPDPFVAREMIARCRPNVITLDLEMPRMDGISFLKKLMEHFPIPVIIVSSLAPKNSEMALLAIECGAVDVVAKPGFAYSIDQVIPDLLAKIRVAALIDRSSLLRKIDNATARGSLSVTTNKIIAIGASTGGTRALESILPTLSKTCPGILITQHMPSGFTKSFSDRLNTLCEVDVKEAEVGDAVLPGRVLVAPGNYHMVLKRDGARYVVDIISGEQVYYQRPSVEVLFHSVAQHAGKNSIGIILTGMGADGAVGLKAMRDSGAVTVAQDRESSTVWGMPGEAVKIDAAQFVLPLMEIFPKILRIA